MDFSAMFDAALSNALAELAEHSSIQTTQRYIDVNPQQMSAAVELL